MTRNNTRNMIAVFNKYNSKHKEGPRNVHMNITLHTNTICKFIFILRYLLLFEDNWIIMFWSCNGIKAAFKIYPLLLREKLKCFFNCRMTLWDLFQNYLHCNVMKMFELGSWFWMLIMNSIWMKLSLLKLAFTERCCTSCPMVHSTLSDGKLLDLKTSLTWWLYIFIYFK